LDIKKYDNDNFKVPIRTIQEREQHEIDFKFKSIIENDWLTYKKDIEPMIDKSDTSVSSIFDWSATTEDVELMSNKLDSLSSTFIQNSSPFDDFLEQLDSNISDKSECSALSEQTNDIYNSESVYNESYVSVDSKLIQSANTNKDENDN